jgi:hypothetical protein
LNQRRKLMKLQCHPHARLIDNTLACLRAWIEIYLHGVNYVYNNPVLFSRQTSTFACAPRPICSICQESSRSLLGPRSVRRTPSGDSLSERASQRSQRVSHNDSDSGIASVCVVGLASPAMGTIMGVRGIAALP